MDNENNAEQHENHGQSDLDNRFSEGFIEGFSRARQIFWRDFLRKAEDSAILAKHLRDSGLGNSEQVSYFSLMDATYTGVADAIARSHTLYPGAMKDPGTQGEVEFYAPHLRGHVNWDDPATHNPDSHRNMYCRCSLYHH